MTATPRASIWSSKPRAQAQIDEEVLLATIGLPVGVLRTKRNALSPATVSCLPDELFILCARQNHISKAKAKAFSTAPARAWVRVFYDCHRRRMVALSCPILWT